MRGGLALGLLATLVVVGPGPARAAEIVVDVEGDCPSAAQVEAELPRGLPASARLRVEVLRRGDRLQIRLVDGRGSAVHRELAGRDCAALAGAIGVIAEGRLLELGELPPPVVAPPPVEPEPAPEPEPAAEEAAEPEPPAASGPRVPLLVPTVIPLPAGPAAYTLGLLGAMVYDRAGGQSSATSAAQVDLGMRLPWYDLRGRAQLGVAGAADLDRTDTGLTRSAYSLRVDVGRRLGPHRVWLQVAGGAALVVSRVRVEFPEPVASFRLHLAASLAADVGVRLAEGISLRLAAGLLAFPFADEYLVAGEVAGSSPRTSLSIGLGLDVALGSKKD